MILNSDSYSPPMLWPVSLSNVLDTINEKMPPGQSVESPNGQYRYCMPVLPRGEWLKCALGREVGQVCFDGPVGIPKLLERVADGTWSKQPWMSYTPQEVFTQRAGIRRAKGEVVVAGLGMGWMLMEVARKKTVTKVTVVEISQQLVNWLLPQAIAQDLSLYDKIFVEVGDATEIVPKMKADVALIDIDASYGGNTFPRCPRIPFVWVWGAQHLEREVWW